MLINFLVQEQCTDTLILYLFAHKNIEKTPSKIGYVSKIGEIFSTAGRPKTSPNLKFCFIKIAHRVTYIK